MTTKSWSASVDRLSDLLHRLGKRSNVPHAVVAVESGDRSFHWAGATGTADTHGTSMSDTPYFLASIDKLINATIVLRLHERGQVRLDESRDLLRLSKPPWICARSPRVTTSSASAERARTGTRIRCR
jgi:hypothetical protein